MHTKTILSVFISLLIIPVTCAVLKAASPEERYFETRDRFIRQSEKATPPGDDRSALAELEKQMRAIVGKVKIKGFSGQGKINLWTLKNDDIGFGQVDGLRFDSGRESLFVTTKGLLKRYLAESTNLPATLREISKTGDFYRRVFHSDAGVIYYAEVPVASGKNQSFAYAFLGVSAQDIAPFIPNEIFVFVSTETRILIVYAPAAIAITDIPQCRSDWEKFNQKSSEAFEIYRASQFKDKEAIACSHLYREQGFAAYTSCFGKEAKGQQFFASLEKQAQAIVDRLQNNYVGKEYSQ